MDILLKKPNFTNYTNLIVAGDLHWSGRNPRSRTDNYAESLTKKIDEIFMLAEKHEAKGIIIPGDIFDSTGLSLSTIIELIIILRSSPVRIYTIAGNHDLYEGNPLSTDRTPYGILFVNDIIHDLDEEPAEIGDKIYIMGRSFDCSITDKDIRYYIPAEKAATIMVTHGMLLEKSPGYELQHTLLSDVANHPDAPPVLINGHEHNGFRLTKINDTLFINPGSIGRIKASEENINRIPQVTLLTICDDGEIEAKMIPLRSAKPGHEVLSREHIEEEKRRQELTKEFLGLLAEEGKSKHLSLSDIIRDIADRDKIPLTVTREALKRLEEAKEVLDHEQRTGTG